MKTLSEKLKARRQKERPKITVEIRLPADVVEDLKEMAPVLGVSNYQALIRAYISMGMREDESALNRPEVLALLQALKRDGVADEVISERVAETLQKSA